jgi:putrescine transport system substrate-binding protein
MPKTKVVLLPCAVVSGWLSAAPCGVAQTAGEVVNVYNWADYIAPATIAAFEAEHGIRVNYDTYDSSEIVDAKLLAGASGYDVVLHSGQYASRLIPIGVFRPLDKRVLAHWRHLDPEVLELMAVYDPGNRYAAPYMWGSTGFAYNVRMIDARMPDAPVDSGAMIFDPEIASQFADCGISFLDSPTDVIPMALAYLGLDANTIDPVELERAAGLLRAVRPHVRYFSSTRLLNDLPNGEVCIAMSWSGEYATAKRRAAEAGIDVDLAYTVPREGSISWFDAWFIPSDAPHPEAANLFIDFLLRPAVIAEITDYTAYANANLDAAPHVEAAILDDPAIYPSAAVKARLQMGLALPPKDERARTRAFARMKTGL